MKHFFWLLPLLLLIPMPGRCDTSATDSSVLFITQELTYFSSYQKELLTELQVMGRYRWVPHKLTFADTSLPKRFEQVKPISDEFRSNTAVWIDETSDQEAMIQLLAIAPGRMSLRTLEVDRSTQPPQDIAIVIDEMLRQTDQVDSAESTPSEVPPQATDENAEKERETPLTAPGKPARLHRIMSLGAGADMLVYSPLTPAPGATVEGCIERHSGLGGCVSVQAGGRRNQRISDVNVSQFHLRPGLSIYWSNDMTTWAFGPAMGIRPVWQYVVIAPDGYQTERTSMLNGAVDLTAWIRILLGSRVALQFRLGGLIWFRSLEFTRQSTGGVLFQTPRFTPTGAVLLGFIF